MELIGLIPAAGKATRLPQLPCSKEIFPIGIGTRIIDNQVEKYPRPIITYLLEQFIQANVTKCIVITQKDKPDILRYLGDGSSYGINIAYQVQERMLGMPIALDLAYPWIKEAIVIFGMPDTIFSPSHVFLHLFEQLTSTHADLTLGLFPTNKPSKFGMVEFKLDTGDFIYTVDKPITTDLRYMWGAACWNQNFSNYLHDYVQNYVDEEELVFSTILQGAHQNGLKINVLPFENGEFIDIGTSDDLVSAMVRLGKFVRQ